LKEVVPGPHKKDRLSWEPVSFLVRFCNSKLGAKAQVLQAQLPRALLEDSLGKLAKGYHLPPAIELQKMKLLT
jgi:hypothetical protein